MKLTILFTSLLLLSCGPQITQTVTQPVEKPPQSFIVQSKDDWEHGRSLWRIKDAKTGECFIFWTNGNGTALAHIPNSKETP